MSRPVYSIHDRTHAKVLLGDVVKIGTLEGLVSEKSCNGKVYSYRVELYDGGICTVIDDRPWWEAGGEWGGSE